jgi:hypothetical protein
VGDRELELWLPRSRERPRRTRPYGEGSSADSILRLQRMSGNSAVAALLQRAPAGTSATPASIGQALSEIKVSTTKKTVKMLEPWEIFRLVTANTPKKKALYKELRQAWSALEAANKRLAAAGGASAMTSPDGGSVVARRTRHKPHKPADPGADRAAAAEAVETAQKRVDKAIEAIKEFILSDADVLRKLRAEERSLKKTTIPRAEATLDTLKKRKHPDSAKVSAAEKVLADLKQALAAIPHRREEAIAQVKERVAHTSFAPEAVDRTVYNFEIEGETVTLSDRVESWATMFENGLVEADRAVKTKLDDVLAGTTLSESNKKILRAISDNESGGAPWSSVNTYDRAVLTWGLVQWTGGSHSDLTAALATIKTVAPESFAARFEKYGIDVVDDELVITGADGSTVKGDAAALRIQGSPALSAVMSRAGLDANIQQAEVAAAAQQQITGPLSDSFAVGGKKLRYSQVLTSEYAVGLFADQVVNSGKGGTQRRVADAVREYASGHHLDPENLDEWVAELQKVLIPLLSPFANRAVPFAQRGCSKETGSYRA